MNIKRTLGRNINNFKGWRTNKYILVLESDDWGSIRMPSKKVYEHFYSKGFSVDKNIFGKNDTLANKEDLEMFFHTLQQVKNINGQNPVITANTIVANPDFQRIQESNYKEYFFEPFTDTLKSYYPGQNIFNLWKDGIDKKLFFPQFHGREHYNIKKWLKLLQKECSEEREAFMFEMVGIPSSGKNTVGNQLQIALDVEDMVDLIDQKKILEEGLALFEKIFEYKSRSFVAPVYTWNSALDKTLSNSGVEFLQGGKYQISPIPEIGKVKIKHRLGEINTFDQRYITRNVFFEPTTNPKKDWVEECMKDVRAAFFWKKPAIISTHRLNYIGGLCPENRDRGNKLLLQFLHQVVKEFPSILFMTSPELGDLIIEETN